MMDLGVIADDFTGAMDTSAEFAASCGLTQVMMPHSDSFADARTVVLNTASRLLPEDEAYKRGMDAAKRLTGRVLFKKIDSTLRGNTAAEISAVLQVTRQQYAVICPAVIELDRKVIGGELWVGGKRLHETAFAHDPHSPATTSALEELVQAPTTHLARAQVLRGPQALAAAILSSPTQLITCDAQTLEDLAVIAMACSLADALPCGALGLGRAWSRIYKTADAQVLDLPTIQAPLHFIVGSQHPISFAQAEHLSASSPVRSWDIAHGLPLLPAAGSTLLHLPQPRLHDRHQLEALVQALVGWVRLAYELKSVGALVLVGGETAGAVLHGLGTESVQVRGALQPGIAFGIVQGGVGHGLPLLTKAGGFGSPSSLTDLYQTLVKENTQ